MRIYFREYRFYLLAFIILSLLFSSIDDASVAFHILKDVVYKGYRYVEEKYKTRKQSIQTKLEDVKERKADTKTEDET